MNDYYRKRLCFVAGLLLGNALALSAASAARAQESDSSGFSNLFDGKTLTGWDGDPRFWKVQDGVIVGETTAENPAEKNTFLIHRGGEYGDFELRLLYQVEGFNSGVQYRSVDQGSWSVAGYQCDFEARWHKPKGEPDAMGADKFTGMFFEEGGRGFMGQRGEIVIARPNPENPKAASIEKIGSVGDAAELESHINREDWNELIVIATGNQFVHIVNGHAMAIGIDEDEKLRRAKGIFAFQLHSGTPMRIELKDIRVRQLGQASATSTSEVPQKKN
ncbi:3-keto-disaccharide hydrolase [Aureliella helgolandensis]|uniref:3-keto-alpha-glucoside-1,2-lyase/3-keto-2-hydroxy-glucal hydratase domain-containing protein n=1 Tax=Aureliella helgolandensis TaxID=2527968 RepID=A0A518G7C6_9BACT|nr:DUF1080 domain-containing protein [Aureliella helgolandensis]QDV24494.1 hypothetical protein Q31a_28120 [Aureliella helgolandensis]